MTPHGKGRWPYCISMFLQQLLKRSTWSHETSAHNLFIYLFFGVDSWSQNDNMATSITWRRRTWRGLDKKQVDCTWHEGTSCHIFTWSVCRATNQFVVFIYQTNCEETLSRQAQPPALPQDFFRLCEQNKTIWPNVNAAVDLISRCNVCGELSSVFGSKFHFSTISGSLHCATVGAEKSPFDSGPASQHGCWQTHNSQHKQSLLFHRGLPHNIHPANMFTVNASMVKLLKCLHYAPPTQLSLASLPRLTVQFTTGNYLFFFFYSQATLDSKCQAAATKWLHKNGRLFGAAL